MASSSDSSPTSYFAAAGPSTEKTASKFLAGEKVVKYFANGSDEEAECLLQDKVNTDNNGWFSGDGVVAKKTFEGTKWYKQAWVPGIVRSIQAKFFKKK